MIFLDLLLLGVFWDAHLLLILIL